MVLANHIHELFTKSSATPGGVPKKKDVSKPVPPLFRAESSLNYPSDPDHKSWINYRIWQSGSENIRPYGGFDFVSNVAPNWELRR